MLGIVTHGVLIAVAAFLYAWGAHWHMKHSDLESRHAVAVAAAAQAAAAESKRNAEAFAAESTRVIETQGANLNAQAKKLDEALAQSAADAVVAQRLRDALVAARRASPTSVPGVPASAPTAAASAPAFGAVDVAGGCVLRLAELARAARQGLAAGNTCVGAYDALRSSP